MSARPDKKQHRYGIGTVARMTGLTDHTIRVWERRYSAVVAERADNGRRQYSEQDVEKLGLLKRLTDEGVSISQVASLDISELRSRTQSLREMHEPRLPERLDVAVLGDFLPTQLAEYRDELAPIRLAVSDSSRERFVADLTRNKADVVVYENAVLDADTVASLQAFIRDADARAGVIVYKFGASKDIERARALGVVLMRSPSDIENVRSTILRALNNSAPQSRREPRHTEQGPGDETGISGEIPPRLFTASQLVKLSKISTAIDCECPSQLAAIVNEVSAFEVYSANCANRNEEDEKLHRYLHHVSAEARALIERALQRVIEVENIKL